jgi:hypothetical protein
LAIAAGAFGALPPEYVQGALELGYVALILPILGSGICITVQSIITAWRERSITSVGIAAWNTYAQVHNTVSAVRTLPGALSHLGDLFSKSEEDSVKGKALLFMILLVIAAIAGGILTTTAIVRRTARAYSSSVLQELERTRPAA